MSFKQHLVTEDYILQEYTKHSIPELISRGSIPLDPGMMDRLGFSEKGVQAYHLTNLVNLEEMIQNQGKKKQISCFTKGGPELARLPSQPDIMLLLEGTSVIKGDTDLWTLVSTRDRRWLAVNPSKHSKLHFLIQGVIASVVKKIDPEIDVYKLDTDTLAGMIVSLSKFSKVVLYKFYLREMERMLNKNYKYLIEYLRTAADMKYNEIVLTKWKIIQASALDNLSPHIESAFIKHGLPYDVIQRRDLSNINI